MKKFFKLSISHAGSPTPFLPLCPRSPSWLSEVPRMQGIPSGPLPHCSQVVPRRPPFSPPSGRRARDARSRARVWAGGCAVGRGGGQGHGSAASVPPPPPTNLAASPPAGPARRAASRDHPREAQTFFSLLQKLFLAQAAGAPPLFPLASHLPSTSLPLAVLEDEAG